MLGKLNTKQVLNVYKTNLGKMLANHKEKLNLKVYRVNCSSCSAMYIAQSGRMLKTRISAHIKSIKYNVWSLVFLNTALKTIIILLIQIILNYYTINLFEQLEINEAMNNHKLATNNKVNFSYFRY